MVSGLSLFVLSACSSHTKAKTSTELLLNERMAAVLLREGRAREAEDAYRDVLRSDPKKPDLHDGLGLCLLAQGKLHEALESFDRAVKLDAEKALYRIHRGMARTQLARYGEAEEDFRVAERSPSPEDQFDLALNRGRMRLRMGDYAAAEEQFTFAIAREPKSMDALLGRGMARESRKDLAAAAEDYLEAVRVHPKSPEANLHLGLALVTLKKTALGRRYLERTVELDPTGDAGARARLLLENGPPSYRRSALARDLRLWRTGERLGRMRPRSLACSRASAPLPRRAPPPSITSGDYARRDRGWADRGQLRCILRGRRDTDGGLRRGDFFQE